MRNISLATATNPHWEAEIGRWLAEPGGVLREWLGQEKQRFQEGWRWLAMEDNFIGLYLPGWSMTVKGRLDRIDTHPTEGLMLWDYKTGSVLKQKEIEEDRSRFQLLGYLLAVQQGLTRANSGEEIRAGIIGLKSSRTDHLKFEDFKLSAADWQKVLENKLLFISEIGQKVGMGDFRPDPSQPPPAQGNSCQYLPLNTLMRLSICRGGERSRMTTTPKDQQQRQKAIDQSLSVHMEAPAGSGKTTVLMKRFLSLLARVREPEEILALTFTRKAAGELRARIQGELLARTDKDGNLPLERDPHKAELQELARAAFFRHVDKGGVSFLERLQISTFHGFCAQILRSAPHAAGLPPDFTLLEESTTTRMQKEAVELMRRQLTALPGGDPARQALVQRLVRLNNNWPRLAAELQGLLSRRDILAEFITLARESRDPAAYEAVLRQSFNINDWPRTGQTFPGIPRIRNRTAVASILPLFVGLRQRTGRCFAGNHSRV